MLLQIMGLSIWLRANSEVQIRKKDMPEDEKECQIKEASDRITEGEVRVLGALAYLGHLAE